MKSPSVGKIHWFDNALMPANTGFIPDGLSMNSTEETLTEEMSEQDRLTALKSLEILDTAPSESFDRLTSILLRVLDMPIALVCFVDKDRHWFKSNRGFEGTSEIPRDVGFCEHVISKESPEVLVIHDALKDSRVKDNPLVTGPPYIRFYAGAPIGIKIGGKVDRQITRMSPLPD